MLLLKNIWFSGSMVFFGNIVPVNRVRGGTINGCIADNVVFGIKTYPLIACTLTGNLNWFSCCVTVVLSVAISDGLSFFKDGDVDLFLKRDNRWLHPVIRFYIRRQEGFYVLNENY